MKRRRFLGLAGGSTAAVLGGVAVDNAVLGYGRLTGTNLLEQNLGPLLDQRLSPVDGRTLAFHGSTVRLEPARVHVDGEALAWGATDRAMRGVEDDAGLPTGSLVGFVHDLHALRTREHDVETVRRDEFFERVAGADPRPYAVEALRGRSIASVDPGIVERFAGADPADPEGLLAGLVEGFREHTFYDAPRYVAGATEDNLLRGRVDLRGAFASPTDFESLLAGENHGAFCYDLADRSLEALHAVPAVEQTVPVVGCYVRDARHKHAYTGIATVVDDDGLALVATFVDYTTTTAARDVGLRGVRGDDPNAYNDWHRATDVYWDRDTRS